MTLIAGQCDCAERSVDRFVFTCPICVAKVIETSAFRFLTEAVASLRIDSTGSVSASVEGEELCG